MPICPFSCRRAASRVRERPLRQAVQLAQDEVAATGAVVDIAAVIDGPDAGVGVGRAAALDGIDQPVALAQGEVQAAAHGGAAQHVAQELHLEVARVVAPEGLCADDDMRLVRVLSADDGGRLSQGIGNKHASFRR